MEAYLAANGWYYEKENVKCTEYAQLFSQNQFNSRSIWEMDIHAFLLGRWCTTEYACFVGILIDDVTSPLKNEK